MFLRDTKDISERVAIADEFGNRLTYGELEELSLDYKTIIPERSLVLMLCDYSIESVSFYYCQMTNHVVPMLVDKNLNTDLLLKIIKTYEPEFIWCSYKAENVLRELISDVVHQGKDHIAVRTVYGSCEMDPRLALLLTTSGSTGSLKFVRLSYENLRSNAQGYVKKVNLNPDDRAITTLPMHYCYGLSIPHAHWTVGACAYLTEHSVLDVKFWEMVKGDKITNFAGVSYTYDMLSQIGFLDKTYKHLRFITQGGTKLSNERQMEFGVKLQEKNIKFYICYGQTEATTYISILDYEKVSKKLGSIGTPIPGINVSIVDSDRNGEGELVCEGKSISLGYAINKSDLARGDDNSGCLHTGDYISIDKDGDIFIKGRKARFVKILGARVSLDEIETALSKHFPITEFACVGEDNNIRIYCVGENLEKEIQNFCSKELSIPKKMVGCQVIEALPYTSNGKIQYVELQN